LIVISQQLIKTQDTNKIEDTLIKHPIVSVDVQ